MIRTTLLLALFLLAGHLCAQQQPALDSVAVYFEKIKTGESDSLKISYADTILKQLDAVGFNTYNSLLPIKYLGHKLCTNAEVELFSWSVPLQAGLAYYNLFRFKAGQRYCLKYIPGEISDIPPYLFYDLLMFKSEKTDYFVLLGWGEAKKTNKKIVLVARFAEHGTVDFTPALLRKGASRSASLSFEYGKEVSMMLKHDKKGKRIIFDHLSPAEKRFEGAFMFYGPDATYNALLLKKGEWWLRENVKP